MKPYIYLPHTADAKFRAFGATLNDAFKNAAYAMTDVMTDHTKLKSIIKRRIKIVSEDHKALLYDFLEQLIILLDTERFLLAKIKDLKIIEKKNRMMLNATVEGANNPDLYQIKTTIKAVTYQEMEVKREKDKFVLQVVVDI